MKRVLLLGGTGFIGRNVLPQLCERYGVVSPARTELDLLDVTVARRYMERGRFDAVVHLATPTAHNPLDKLEDLFSRSLRIFASLAHCSDLYDRMIYIGSGAEYGKHRTIANISEIEYGKELPRDDYGLSRYIMSELAQKRGNIVNLRLFGCCGYGDPPHKLIPYAISCIKANQPIELRQNTMFDFLYVKDIAPVLLHFVENRAKDNAYNLCSGTPVLTGDIAAEARRQMESDAPIEFENDGLGLEYTGSNERLRAEMPDWKPRTIPESIKEILEYENRRI